MGLFKSSKSNSLDAKRNKRSSSKKDSKKVDDFELDTVQDDLVEDNNSFEDLLPKNKVVSTDKNVSSTIILQTYLSNCKISKPESLDKFISNSRKLSKKLNKFYPWFMSNYEPDPYIDDCIGNASSEDEFCDFIEDSGIVDFDSNSLEELSDSSDEVEVI